jgi:DNA topoisomerase-1
MEAYCLKCKTKREMTNPVPGFNSRASPVTTGTCSVCGTKMIRMGATEAHAGLERPVVVRGPKGKKPVQRSGKLVIVESPAKAKTVRRFLGKGFQVEASVGHIRDLLKSRLSVDVDNGFTPTYRVPKEKKAVVKDIKAKAAAAEEIFLATDPDREGEAISWHLIEAANIAPELARRVVFHEITEPAIAEAFSHPRDIDMRLVNAQQARRILDRLVGYSLSPLLWAKVRGRLSAGRVQSVAVRLIVDREREIDAFVPREYWTIEAELTKTGDTVKKHHFFARLIRVGDREVGLEKEIPLQNQAEVEPLLKDLEGAQWKVLKVKKGERRRNAPPPFTTSTLQQEASRKLGFTAKRTMSVAQQLYEGIELNGDSAVGLITYMRTDSTNVSAIAQQETREYVSEKFGPSYLPPEPPQHKTRAKGAQEAHEAIRPTAVAREPKAIEHSLTKEQFRLYQLIWQRFVASQMSSAVYDTVSVDIEAASQQVYTFRAAGSVVTFKGFLAVYEEAKEEDAPAADPAEGEGKRLPPLADDDPLSLIRLVPEQHFTQPPPRYTEATLVKALEEYGIGRPSTYAPTLATIQARGYVRREEKRLFPTEIGILVNDLLVVHFPEIVDLGFTARMEEELDEIASGEREWVPVLHEFYGPFSQSLKAAEAEMPQMNTGPEFVGRDCPQCGRPLVYRYSRYGKFIGCSGFSSKENQCRFTEQILEKIGVACPKDGGDIVERKSRKGRIFYGCINYPNCDWTSWKKPIKEKCPTCGSLMVIANKTTAACTNPDCGAEVLLDSLVVEVAA